ncbi:hypothetical protein ACMZ4W_01713 [Brevundimonas naejangsanensis]
MTPTELSTPGLSPTVPTPRMRAVVKVWFEVEATIRPGARICRSLMSRTPTPSSRGWAATVSDSGVAASGASRRSAVTTISDTWIGPASTGASARTGAAKASTDIEADARDAARTAKFMGGKTALRSDGARPRRGLATAVTVRSAGRNPGRRSSNDDFLGSPRQRSRGARSEAVLHPAAMGVDVVTNSAADAAQLLQPTPAAAFMRCD